LLFLLHLGVGFDEFSHADDVLGNTSAAVAAFVSGADDELDQVLGVNKTFFFTTSFFSDLNEGSARVVPDGITGHPVSVLVTIVVVFQTAGLVQKSLSGRRVGTDTEIRDHGVLHGDGGLFCGDACSEESEDGGSVNHCHYFFSKCFMKDFEKK